MSGQGAYQRETTVSFVAPSVTRTRSLAIASAVHDRFQEDEE